MTVRKFIINIIIVVVNIVIRVVITIISAFPEGKHSSHRDRVTCQAFAPPPTFSHDLVSAQGGEIKIIITITTAVTIMIIFTRPAQGNEMKIQKVFEAFEQFRLGEENIAHLVTQLEASLMQVIYCNWASIIESAGQSL